MRFDELVADSSWRARAACRGLDTNLFFPERGDNSTLKEARALCATCPVREECLAVADPIFGLWGGLTPDERLERRKRLGLPPPPRPRLDEILGFPSTTPGAERTRRSRENRRRRELAM